MVKLTLYANETDSLGEAIPLELLGDGVVIGTAVTDAAGVASFNSDIAGIKQLTVRIDRKRLDEMQSAPV